MAPMRRSTTVPVLMSFVVAGLLSVSGHEAVARPDRSEQVVFSGIGSGTFAGTPTPFGFWIWCEAESNNPYVGECAGAMYFYALGITKHVFDAEEPGIVENGDGSYTMHVRSDDGSVDCLLTNDVPTQKGPRNMVNVSCSAPAGSGASGQAVVNVTGPAE